MTKKFKYYQYVIASFDEGQYSKGYKFVSDEEITYSSVRKWLNKNEKNYKGWSCSVEFIERPKTEIL